MILSDKRLKQLKERNFGDFEGESEDLNPKRWSEFNYDDLFPHYGGEYTHDVVERMSKCLLEIMENDEEIEQYKKFLTNFRNKIEKQPQARIKRSIPVQIFDWLFHTYSHNPHAIICPRCGVNNGLCDDPKTVQYYCMNCGCNEKGEEFEIVEEEDAENNEMNEVQEGKLE